MRRFNSPEKSIINSVSIAFRTQYFFRANRWQGVPPRMQTPYPINFCACETFVTTAVTSSLMLVTQFLDNSWPGPSSPWSKGAKTSPSKIWLPFLELLIGPTFSKISYHRLKFLTPYFQGDAFAPSKYGTRRPWSWLRLFFAFYFNRLRDHGMKSDSDTFNLSSYRTPSNLTQACNLDKCT